MQGLQGEAAHWMVLTLKTNPAHRAHSSAVDAHTGRQVQGECLDVTVPNLPLASTTLSPFCDGSGRRRRILYRAATCRT